MTDERGSVGGDGGDKELKVTDKRMFTPDGRLREEYRHLEEKGPSAAAPRATEAAPGAAESTPRPAEAAGATAARAAAGSAPGGPAKREGTAPERDPGAAAGAAPGAPSLEIPGTPEGLGAPSFLDLVTLLAEPIALYLGDVELPDGKSAENLELARLHIDLLDVLRRKTAGNLTVEESSLLEDLLYRCRLRYVQKRG